METLKYESLSPCLKCDPVSLHKRVWYTEQFSDCVPNDIFLHSVMLENRIYIIFDYPRIVLVSLSPMWRDPWNLLSRQILLAQNSTPEKEATGQ